MQFPFKQWSLGRTLLNNLSTDLLAATELKLKGKGSDALQPVAIQLFSNHNTHTHQKPVKIINGLTSSTLKETN